MERRIIEYSMLDDARVVVELGPGTGGTTRALLERMRPDARLVAIDLDSRFTAIVAGIEDPRLIAHTGSAADLRAILRQHGFEHCDRVISGIPFSTMPADLGREIMHAIRDNLTEGGAFVAYQFRAEVARIAEPVFGLYQQTDLVTLNIPPMRIWRWRKGEV
ncbi:MAG: class I SAM-dependent methyltransferase [Wenzhouxiangellaceae bacterium]